MAATVPAMSHAMVNEKAATDKRELNSQAGEPVGLALALGSAILPACHAQALFLTPP